MRFTLEVRKIDERCLSSVTPFLPEDDEYEMYLNALLEDFSRIEVICEVSRNGSIFQIETNCSILPADLQAIIKPILKSEIMNNLRFVSLLEKCSTLENMA